MKTRTTSGILVSCVLALAAPISSGQCEPTLRWPAPGVKTEIIKVEEAGDIDGDMTPDLLVLAWEELTDKDGIVLLSGATFEVIDRVMPNQRNYRYWDMSGRGYFDHDRVPDFAAIEGKYLRLFSGADRRMLAEWDTPGGIVLAGDVLVVGDVNDDFISDIMVSNWNADGSNGYFAGAMAMLSGADGSVIWRREGEFQRNQLGYFLRRIKDLDGDGAPDVIAGSANNGSDDCDAVHVFSGRTGEEIRYYSLCDYNLKFLKLNGDLEVAGDVNGDDVEDIVIGADLMNGSGPSHIVVVSGASDQATLHESFCPIAGGANWARMLSGGHDYDRDGFDDFVITDAEWPSATRRAPWVGRVEVYSGATGTRIQAFVPEGEPGLRLLGVESVLTRDLTGDGLGDLVCVVTDSGDRDRAHLALVPGGCRALLLNLPLQISVHQEVTFEVRNARPGWMVYLAASLKGLGEVPIPALGIVLDIKGPKILGTMPADTAGLASFTGMLPPDWEDRLVVYQAFQHGRVSPVEVQTKYSWW